MSRRPNFLFLVTDQQRWDHVGFAGNPTLRTPNIDRIAHEGSWVPRFYVSSPVCMSNRATFMTGRMPSLHGVRHNGIGLDLDQTTFVQLLNDAGYRTALIGKCHLQNFVGEEPGYDKESFPKHYLSPSVERDEAVRGRYPQERYETEQRRSWREEPNRDVVRPYYGFEHVELCVGHGDNVSGHYERWLASRAGEESTRFGLEHATERSTIGSPQTYKPLRRAAQYPTTYVEQRCTQLLDSYAASAADRPFFIQCAFPDPHHPFTPPEDYWERYSAADIELPASFHQRSNQPIPPLAHLEAAFNEGQGQSRWTSPFIAGEAQAREIIAKTYGQIALIDDAVGAILDKLEALGLAEDTVVCFMSDHGDWMGDHGLFLKGPLHFQSLIRTPFAWRDPAPEYNRGCIDGVAGTLDLARSVLDRAQLVPFNGIQGTSLMKLFDASADLLERSMLIEQQTQYPYLGFETPVRLTTLVSRRSRLTVWEDCDWGELYDLESDPHELHNLWDDNATLRHSLVLELLHLMQNHQDISPFPTDKG